MPLAVGRKFPVTSENPLKNIIQLYIIQPSEKHYTNIATHISFVRIL